MNYKTKLLRNKGVTIDCGVNGFHDYDTRYPSEEEFCATVNKEMDELRNEGAKKISVQYFRNSDPVRAIDKAVITYMI